MTSEKYRLPHITNFKMYHNRFDSFIKNLKSSCNTMKFYWWLPKRFGPGSDSMDPSVAKVKYEGKSLELVLYWNVAMLRYCQEMYVRTMLIIRATLSDKSRNLIRSVMKKNVDDWFNEKSRDRCPNVSASFNSINSSQIAQRYVDTSIRYISRLRSRRVDRY